MSHEDPDPQDHHACLRQLRERVQTIEDYLGIKRGQTAPADPTPEPAPATRAPVRKTRAKR